jgi:hypothetical protein
MTLTVVADPDPEFVLMAGWAFGVTIAMAPPGRFG